jgi:hypothetical protein
VSHPVVTVGTTDYLYAELTSGAVKEGDRVLAGYKQQEQ